MPDETKEQLKGEVERLEEVVKELRGDYGDADKYATIGSRVLSTITDIVLVLILWVIIGIVGSVMPIEDGMFLWAIIIMLLFIPFAYFIILEGSYRQRSDHWEAPAAYKSYQRKWRNPLVFSIVYTNFYAIS